MVPGGVGFLEELEKIAGADPPPVPTKSSIVFEDTPAAAATNESIFQSFGFDMGKLIAANQGTTLGYGSGEFRTVNQLKPLLGGHPNFNKLSKILKSGMSYNFDKELDELTKSEELQKLLKRGNHKSAQDCGEMSPTCSRKMSYTGSPSRSLSPSWKRFRTQLCNPSGSRDNGRSMKRAIESKNFE